MKQNPQNMQQSGPPEPSFDLGKKVDQVIEGTKHFNMNRKIVLAGAIISFIATFLPWWSFKYSVFGYPINRGSWNGFHSGGTAAFIMTVLVLIVLFLPYFSKKRQSIKNDTIIYLSLGIIGAIAILATMTTYSSALTFGIFFALAGQALIVVGGYKEFKESKTTTKDFEAPPPSNEHHEEPGGDQEE